MKLMKISFEFIKSIAASLIGGFIAALIFSLCQFLSRKYRAYRIKKILGPDAGRGKVIHVFYPSSMEIEPKPIPEKTKPNTKKSFTTENPIIQSEVRAIGYLNNFFSQVPGTMEIFPDITDAIIRPYELSQISLGDCKSNRRTEHILEVKENRFIKVESDGIGILKCNGKFGPFPGKKVKDDTYDYGIILRITVERKEKKVWIACTGLSRWGTSGAAYFLAKNWKQWFKASLSWWKRILLFRKRLGKYIF